MPNLTLHELVTEKITAFLEKNQSLLDNNAGVVNLLNKIASNFNHLVSRDDLLKAAILIEEIPVKSIPKFAQIKKVGFFGNKEKLQNKLDSLLDNEKSLQIQMGPDNQAIVLQKLLAKDILVKNEILPLDADKDAKLIDLLKEIHEMAAVNYMTTRVTKLDAALIESAFRPNTYDLSKVEEQDLTQLPIIIDLGRHLQIEDVEDIYLARMNDQQKADFLLQYCNGNKELACIIGNLGQELGNRIFQYFQAMMQDEESYIVGIGSKSDPLIYRDGPDYYFKLTQSIYGFTDGIRTYFINPMSAKLDTMMGIEAINNELKGSCRLIPVLDVNLKLKLDSVQKKFFLIENSLNINCNDKLFSLKKEIIIKDYKALGQRVKLNVQKYSIQGEDNTPDAIVQLFENFSKGKNTKLSRENFNGLMQKIGEKVLIGDKNITNLDIYQRAEALEKLVNCQDDEGVSTAFDFAIACAEGKLDSMLAAVFDSVIEVDGESGSFLPVNLQDAQYQIDRRDGQLYVTAFLQVDGLKTTDGRVLVADAATGKLAGLNEATYETNTANKAFKPTEIGRLEVVMRLEELPNKTVKPHFESMNVSVQTSDVSINQPEIEQAPNADVNLSNNVNNNNFELKK